MLNHSDVRRYRELSVGRSDEEKTEIFNKIWAEREEEERRKFEIKSPEAKDFYNSFKLIDSVSIKPEFADNKEEIVIIEKRKEFIKNYFLKILEGIKKYMSVVTEQESLSSKKFHDSDKFRDAMMEVDHRRRHTHNALVSDIKMLVRNININFNKNFPEEIRIKLESQMPHRKNMSVEEVKNIMNQRNYVEFPGKSHIFIDLRNSSSDPALERDIVANWAVKMYEDFTSLNNKLE